MDEEPGLRRAGARRPVLLGAVVLVVAGALALGGVLIGSRVPTVGGAILLIACSWTLRGRVLRRR